jgi:SAM-dependent methyltransferase
VAQDLSEADLLRFASEIFSDETTAARFINEARFGLSRLLPILSSINCGNLDVLEVGAGCCILSAYLTSKKIRVTAVEPLGPEFDFFTELQARVLEFCRRKGIPLKLVRATGERFDLPEQFDFAFTINALEHMRDPFMTIDNMYKSLKAGGHILLHCPNYTIPFEVHFNVLLLTRSKRLNEWLHRSKIAQYPKVWDELNFIRYIDVRRHLCERSWNFIFNRSVMRDLVERLLDDSIFAQRMPFLLRAIGSMLRSVGMVRGLTLAPLRLQTPMEVLIKKDQSRSMRQSA